MRLDGLVDTLRAGAVAVAVLLGPAMEVTEGHVALGCDVAQGYAIGRPMPVEDLLTWMAHWDIALQSL